jgi:hypothetical protein
LAPVPRRPKSAPGNLQGTFVELLEPWTRTPTIEWGLRSVTVSAVESDADLLLDLNRALRRPLMSLETGAGRERRIAESDRLLKSVAKQLAQRAGDSADDRRSREVIRVRVYNTLAPILLEMRVAHEGTMSLARRVLFASIALCVAIGALFAALR